MTAHLAAKLSCDHRYPERSLAERYCRERVADGTYGERTPGLPDGTYIWSKADARREARKLGWATGVRASGARGGPFDYCPAHKPERTAGAA